MNFFDDKNFSLHSEIEQLRRQKSALKLKIDSINFLEKSGIVSGHFCSLKNCDCMDFAMRGKPCKHIYRLAEDLGVFKISSKTSDKNIVATDVESKTKYFRDILKDKIRNVSTEAQIELQKFTYSPKKRLYEKYTNKFIDELIDSGLLVANEITLRESIEKLTIAEIRKMFTKEKPKKDLKKNELVKFFIENYPKESEEYYSTCYVNKVYLELSEEILDNLNAIHRFLCSLVGSPSDRYNYF